MVRYTFLLALLSLGVLPASAQQTPKGFAPCHAFTISNCGPSVILMNIGSQEALFNIGQTTATVAASTNYSLPGNSFIMITVPDQTAAAATNPTNGETRVTGTITIRATCTDSHSVTSVALSVDGLLVATATTAPYQASFDTTLLLDSNNPHTATAVCTNIGGATSTASNTFSTNNGVIPPKTFYLATAAAGGNDSNPGTIGSPWLSPRHKLRCGDTILAVPSQTFAPANFDGGWGSVWSCPTADGLQFAFLKCNGSFIQDCFVNSPTGMAIRTDQDHWAIQGWYASAPGNSQHCFAILPVPGRPVVPTPGGFANAQSTFPQYMLWVNDYANNCGGGLGIQDYEAWVGGLIYGSGYNGGNCYSGISIAAPFNNNPLDTGTHIFAGGSFFINNYNSPGCTDGEGLIIDDWNLGADGPSSPVTAGYSGQGYLSRTYLLAIAGLDLRLIPPMEVSPRLRKNILTTTPFGVTAWVVAPAIPTRRTRTAPAAARSACFLPAPISQAK